jgi:hypothetical protein
MWGQGGFGGCCLWRDIEIDSVTLCWDLIINTFKENGMSVEMLIDFQFIRNLIRGIAVIISDIAAVDCLLNVSLLLR